MGVAYYEVFITTLSDAIRSMHHYESNYESKNHILTNFRLGVDLVRETVCFFGKLVVGDVV